MISLRQARLNRPFTGSIELVQPNGAGAFVLAQSLGSYRLRLYHHTDTNDFAEASIGNGKMTITELASATVIAFTFPATDMALTTQGYGAMELISVTDTVPVVVPPLMYLPENTPYTVEDGEKLVIFNEKIVAVVAATVLQYIMGPTPVVVNTLPAGSAGSATFDGVTMTLNFPKGDTGSNGVMSAAEVAKGVEALNMATPEPRGTKALVANLIAGGVAGLDDVASHVLAGIENVAGVTLTATAGSFTQNRRKKMQAAVANRLRLAHDIDSRPLGAVIEAAATNLIRQSQTFATSWTQNATTIVNASAPDGTATAARLRDDATTAAHRMNQNTAGTVSGTSYCFSVFAKAGTMDRLQLTRGSGATAQFNLVTGVLVSSSGASLVGAGLTAVGGGWYRCWLTDNAALTAYNAFIGIADNTGAVTYLGTGNGNIVVWGAQLEDGTGPSSYMPTTTIAVTRAADVIGLPLAGFALDQLTLAAELVLPTNLAVSQYIAEVRASGTNRLGLFVNAAGNVVATAIIDGTTFNITLATGLAANALVKVAVSVDTERKLLRGKVTGVAAPADVALTAVATETPLALNLGSNNGNLNFLMGALRGVSLLDRATTATAIAAFTG